MAIIGRALANYLSKLGGMYSVELPESLSVEIESLVLQANTMTAMRAVHVSASALPAGDSLASSSTTWREILAWRNTDDRIFTWYRGVREPDTSFRSVCRPFLSGRFPGSGGGECSPETFVRIGIEEVFASCEQHAVGKTFEAFFDTACWSFDVLVQLFELAGSTPGMHWSDRFLGHWAQLLDSLAAAIGSYTETLVERHAWEIVRLAGIPLPSELADEGNPFLGAPKVRKEDSRPALVRLWSRVVKEVILRDGGIPELLTALDRAAAGPSRSCAWRGLTWSNLRGLPLETPAPVVGSLVLASAPSPSLVCQDIPNTGITTVPSWWGVTTKMLENAFKALQAPTPLVPDPSQDLLLRPLGDQSNVFVLNTRAGVLTHAPTAAKWRARVSVPGIRLQFKEGWSTLHVSALEPGSAIDGDAWVNPDDGVAVTLKGATIDQLNVQPAAGDRLSVSFSVGVDYACSRDKESGIISGSWNGDRTLVVKVDVRARFNGGWEPARRVETEIELVVPSPFSPTFIVARGGKLVAVTPEAQDRYSADPSNPTGSWEADSTPSVVLDEEGVYELAAYDGTVSHDVASFKLLSDPWVGEKQFPAPSGALFGATSHPIDEGVVVVDRNSSTDLVTFRVKERSANHSSGLLSAIRKTPAARKPPSDPARRSVLGQYQDSVTSSVASRIGTGLDSLFQHVIAASATPVSWKPHPGTRAPCFLFPTPDGHVLSGIQNGPGNDLAASAAWTGFMSAAAKVLGELGLSAGNRAAWLSGLDVDLLSGETVREYLAAHVELVDTATSEVDRFWASYPFSVIVVEGQRGYDFGQLRAVLLSPIHPARLAWTFAVTRIARGSKADPVLLGLLEGWNIPCAGIGINAAGQERHLVAVPLDPGSDQDFAAWSALAVLGEGGVATLPLLGAGQSLPWGGRTGINARVIERALGDYLVVHPHVNALEIDLRSIGPSPRSHEIDEALLRLAGAEEMDGINGLGGGAKVWDSQDRQGVPPTRDQFFAERKFADADQAFEWTSYPSSQLPADTDVAFVENATVHLAIVPSAATGVVGPVALRRFTPSEIQGDKLDQSFVPPSGEDVLGLARLLDRIERSPSAGATLAIRAILQRLSLGIGLGAQWEVLGTFNIDPTVLASLVTAAGGQDHRLLWEWRPSWMASEKSIDLAKRPYYVVARLPASLSLALHSRQGFTANNATELLHVLGQRGIGLSVLSAEGGTQESAAAGYFYAVQLLAPFAAPGPLGVLGAPGGPSVYGVVPVDAIEPILEGMAGRPLKRRADLLVIAASWSETGQLQLCVLPTEIKHHGMPAVPEEIPRPGNKELDRARKQLEDTVELLRDISADLASTEGGEAVAGRMLKRLALSTLLDLAMSFSPTPPAAKERARVLRAILGDSFSLGVGDPVLLWFAPGAIQSMGTGWTIDPHEPYHVGDLQVREVYVDPGALPGLWWKDSASGTTENNAKDAIYKAIRLAFSQCARTRSAVASDRDRVSEFLGVPKLPVASVPDAGSSQPAGTAPSATCAPVVEVPADEDDEPRTGEESAVRDDTQEGEEQAEKIADSPGMVETADEPAATTTGPPPPRALVGWNSVGKRFSLVGKLSPGGDMVGIDLDHPKTVGIFGYMGSGKSYLLGTLIESALIPIPGINQLPAPLSVVIFNYRRNASDRFELASLGLPNDDEKDVARLAEDYGAKPAGIPRMHVLCLPGELRDQRLQEYGALGASELYFNPESLDVEDWELLMGEPGSEAVFARTIRNTLGDLRLAGQITLEGLDHQVMNRLTGQSRNAARLRFDFIRRYISAERGIDFSRFLQPGVALIVDLRQPLFNKDDALRFFLVCANQISRVQGRFNKLIVFDEAHEYLSEAFGERMEARIRLMRHEGTSYVFATQDVRSVPAGVSRFLTTRFVFNLGTRENVEDLEQVAPEFKQLRLLDLPPGHCLVQANASLNGLFQRPRMIEIRPRVTKHGGTSQIFAEGE